MDAAEEVGGGNNSDDGAQEGRGHSNTWDFEEDHLLSYFLGGTGAPEPNGIAEETTADGHETNDAGMMHVESNLGPETLSPPAGGDMGMMVDASSAADALAASAAQASGHQHGDASMGSPSVSFNFTHSPITGSLMRGESIPGIGNEMKTGPGPLLPPSSPGTNADHQQSSEGTAQANSSKSRKLPSSSSLKKSSSYTSHGSSKGSSARVGFVIGADDAPPPGRVTFADMGDDNGNNIDSDDPIDEDSKNNIPKMGHGRNGGGRGMFGVEPPSTPATQYFSSSSGVGAGQAQGPPRVPSASVLSTSSSSSSSLDKLGRAMAMNSVNSGQSVMEVHKTLQMKASELPTPPTPQMMMMLGNPAAAAAMAAAAASAASAAVSSTASATGVSSSSAQASSSSAATAAPGNARTGATPGYSPLSPAAGLGSPENMMLPPPAMGWGGTNAGGTAAAAGAAPKPGASQPFPMMNPQQTQAYFLQHQQFLQQLNYNAQMAYAQQQQQQQQQNQRSSPSDTGPRSQKKDLPPCPEVSNEDIVKAAAAAGIINPALGHGRPGRGGVMSMASPDRIGSSAGNGGGRVVETEEKRQQRLARNRESARKSRRQKKERLQTLAAQVSKLQDELEVERRRCIGAMEGGLRQARADVIAGSAEYRPTVSAEEGGVKNPLEQALDYVVRDVGPKCDARSATANFQHNTLQSQMIPNYREFILWLSTQHPSFLYTAKEERNNNNDENVRKTSSSKQIGEEIFGSGNPKKSGKKKSSDDDSSKADLSAKTDDVRRFWPMFCYDMSISVDQEERIGQLQNSMFHSATLPVGRQEVSTAKAITRSLKNSIFYSGHSSAHRSEGALLDILTPEQSARYLQWYAANKDRCDRIIKSKITNAEASADELEPTSLDALSQRLNHALDFREG